MSSEVHPFPSHLIDPKRKDDKWCLKYCKAAHHSFRNGTGHNNIYSRINDWIENRKYAEGNQETDKYKKWLSKLEESGKTVSFMDLDHSIVKIIPKYRDIVLSFMEKVDYNIKVTDIDPSASAERESVKWEIWATKLLKPFIDKMRLKMNAGEEINEEDLPETIEELELFMNMKFELKQEISARVGINGVLYENEWSEVSKLMREDAFDNGVMACKVHTSNGKRIGISYVDPVNVLIDSFRGHKPDGIERIGEYRMITIQQLKQECGGYFTDDQYKEIFEQHRTKKYNSSLFNSRYINTDDIYDYDTFDNCKVLVLDLFWYSLDKKKSKKKKAYGNEYIYPEKFEKKEGKRKNYEVYSTDVKTVYASSWIVGSDWIYNYGKMKDISRYSDNARECMLPIKFYRVSNTSHLERMLPFADAIQLSWLKIQNAKARAMPKGFTVYQEAFENVTIDGKKMKVQELLEIATQTGWKIVSKESSIDDNGNAMPPMIPDEGGLGNEFVELVSDIARNIELIKDVTGINDFMDASNPGERALVGVGKIAVEGTKNAIHPMVSGYSYLKEKTCLDILSKIQIKAKQGKLKYTYPEFGQSIAKTFEIGNEVNNGKFNLRLEQKASSEQRELIKQAATQALTKSEQGGMGGIGMDDYLHIIDLIDQNYIKLAEATLSYRIKRKLKADQKKAEENSRVQGEQQQQLAQITKQEERDTIQFEADVEVKKEEQLAKIEIEKERELAKIKAEHETK